MTNFSEQVSSSFPWSTHLANSRPGSWHKLSLLICTKKGFKILSYLKATLKVAAATTSGVKSEPSATRKADDILWNIFDFHTFIPILEFNNQKQSQNNINTSELGKCILTSQAVMLQWPRRQELTLCMLMCYVRALTVSRIMSTVSPILAFGRIPYPTFFHH